MLERVPFDLRVTLEDVVELYAETAQKKGIELIADYRADQTSFQGDPTRVRQIFSNLLNNAVKFTEGGEIVVRVTHSENTDARSRIQIDVQDSGIGMSAEVQARIFESFSQAEKSTSRTHGGTGLGLSISKQLANLMGGGVEVKSAPNEGSCFTVMLDMEVSTDETGGELAEFSCLVGVPILCVIDNETLRESVQHSLSVAGLGVTSVADGPSALELLRDTGGGDKRYEIVLVDRQLYGMSGVDLTTIIKADPTLVSVSVVLMAPLSDHESLSPERVSGYVTKPIRSVELFNALRTVVQGKTGNHQEASDVDELVDEIAFHGCVLLAEDNLVNQEVALGLLEPLGLDVHVVGTGIEAVAAWERGGYDLVLMDCQMPEMDGIDATIEIRKKESDLRRARPRTPIVALTAFAMESDKNRCLDAGMDDYLSKPFTEDSLQSMLSKWLSSSKQCPEANQR